MSRKCTSSANSSATNAKPSLLVGTTWTAMSGRSIERVVVVPPVKRELAEFPVLFHVSP